MMKGLITVLICVVSSLIFVTQAYAYLDPGTGSMAVQALIAFIAAGSVSIGIFRRRVADFIRRLFGRKPPKADSDNEESKS